MARCDYCGSTIIVGGVKQADGKRFCNQKCHQRGVLVAMSSRVDPGEVAAAVTRVHLGQCPRCGGAGPIDVSTSYKVWSALVLTSWSSSPQISCRSCGRKQQALGALISIVAGWWGFPWGLILTPVQVVRNVAGLFRSYDPYQPSAQLEAAVRLRLGAQLLEQHRAAQAAAAPVAPT